MLSTVNAYMRMSILGFLGEEEIADIENRTEKIKLTTFDGRVFLFERNDVEIVNYDFGDMCERTTYRDDLMVTFQRYDSLKPEDIDLVQLDGVRHRVIPYEDTLMLYNETNREVVLRCPSDKLIQNIEEMCSHYKIYKINNSFL